MLKPSSNASLSPENHKWVSDFAKNIQAEFFDWQTVAFCKFCKAVVEIFPKPSPLNRFYFLI